MKNEEQAFPGSLFVPHEEAPVDTPVGHWLAAACKRASLHWLMEESCQKHCSATHVLLNFRWRMRERQHRNKWDPCDHVCSEVSRTADHQALQLPKVFGSWELGLAGCTNNHRASASGLDQTILEVLSNMVFHSVTHSPIQLTSSTKKTVPVNRQ